jgi:hypothetical protein
VSARSALAQSDQTRLLPGVGRSPTKNQTMPDCALRAANACWRRGRLIVNIRGENMPTGSKATYTSKQKRQARHIEQSYEDKGVGAKEAESRAWATVNKETGGGLKKRKK